MWQDLEGEIAELFDQEHPLSGSEQRNARMLPDDTCSYYDKNKSRAAAAEERIQHNVRIALTRVPLNRSEFRRTETRICVRCGEYFVPRWPSQKKCDVVSCVCRG